MILTKCCAVCGGYLNSIQEKNGLTTSRCLNCGYTTKLLPFDLREDDRKETQKSINSLSQQGEKYFQEGKKYMSDLIIKFVKVLEKAPGSHPLLTILKEGLSSGDEKHSQKIIEDLEKIFDLTEKFREELNKLNPSVLELAPQLLFRK